MTGQKVVIRIHSEANISKTEIQAMFQRIANMYVLDDVSCPVFLFGTDYILSRHFQNR